MHVPLVANIWLTMNKADGKESVNYTLNIKQCKDPWHSGQRVRFQSYLVPQGHPFNSGRVQILGLNFFTYLKPNFFVFGICHVEII